MSLKDYKYWIENNLNKDQLINEFHEQRQHMNFILSIDNCFTDIDTIGKVQLVNSKIRICLTELNRMKWLK